MDKTTEPVWDKSELKLIGIIAISIVTFTVSIMAVVGAMDVGVKLKKAEATLIVAQRDNAALSDRLKAALELAGTEMASLHQASNEIAFWSSSYSNCFRILTNCTKRLIEVDKEWRDYFKIEPPPPYLPIRPPVEMPSFNPADNGSK